MIATTIMSSISVKPDCLRIFVLLFVLTNIYNKLHFY